jgi:hypothetical protein
MRSTHSQSHPLQFSVLNRTLPDEPPTVVGICEQDDPDEGFLVTIEAAGSGGVHGFHLTEPEVQILGRVIQQRFGEQDPLTGQFFHVFKDARVDKQGRVTGVVQPGHYLVAFLGSDGHRSGSEIVKFTDVIDEDWVFYDDEDLWRSIGEAKIGEPRAVRPLDA